MIYRSVLPRRLAIRALPQCTKTLPTCLYQRRHNTTSTPTTTEKPYYVTSPIFYVNAAPHVGHLYTMVITDVLKRWQVLKGRKALLVTGTDEHGMKIQQAANLAQTNPKDFCESGAALFKTLANTANIDFDRFMRTTDLDHREAVQHFWRLLRERDYIYTAKHEGWYCVSDETFYPDSAVEKTIAPSTGEKIIVSKETGKVVEWTSEENYHFRLSAVQPALLEFYKQNPTFIHPPSRMAAVVNEVQKGLEDLSVSRPSSRLTWGVPVPNDSTQTIYVWLDALINYITFTGFPWTPGHESDGGWPVDIHIVGKDIVRFHCIYWPAFLLSLNLPPPIRVLTHAHWTMSHRKMSKSTGNVVNPFFAMERFGVDAMRFYLCHDGGIENDGDYSNEEIIARYSKCLQSQVGSLVTRVCSKKFDLEKIIKLAEGKEGFGAAAPALGAFDERNMAGEQMQLLRAFPDKFAELMEGLDMSGALKCALEVVAETHKFIHLMEPWSMEDPEEVARIMFLSAEAVRMTGIALYPFMPSKMGELLDQISVDLGMRTWEDVKVCGDYGYGVGASGRKGQIFPRLSALE